MRDDHFKALVKDADAVVNGDEGKRVELDAKAAAMECRWLDNLAVEPGTEATQAESLSTFRG